MILWILFGIVDGIICHGLMKMRHLLIIECIDILFITYYYKYRYSLQCGLLFVVV
jgi:hypothetical protein